jgi:hypothetical protein
MNVYQRPLFRQAGGPIQQAPMAPQMAAPQMAAPEAAISQAESTASAGMQQVGLDYLAQTMGGIDAATDAKGLIDALRGNNKPLEARYAELAQLVGEQDAMQTPESVLALVQPTIMMTEQGAVDSGVGELMQNIIGQVEMETEEGAPTQMAGGVGSLMMAGAPAAMEAGQPPVQNFRYGGLVQRFQAGGEAQGRLGQLYSEMLPVYQSVLGPGGSEEAKAQALFAIAQAAGQFAAGRGPQGEDLRGASPAAAFAANLGGLSGSLQQQAAARAQEERALRLAALQGAQQEYSAERAAARQPRAEGTIKGVPISMFERMSPEDQNRLLFGDTEAAKPVILSPGSVLMSPEGQIIGENRSADDKPLVLGVGEIAYNAQGVEVARGLPPKRETIQLSPGETVVDAATGQTIAASQDRPQTFTLGPGQVVKNAAGETIATGPAPDRKTIQLSPGETVVDAATGQTIAASPDRPQTFTLGQGQVVKNAAGQTIAEGPAPDRRTIQLSPGETVIDAATGQTIAASPDRPQTFTLGAGQVVKNAAGETIAEGPPAPEKTHLLGVNQTLVNDKGEVLAVGQQQRQTVTIGPGQSVIDSTTGEVISSVARAPFVLGEGAVAYDEQGNLIAQNIKSREPRTFTLSPGQTVYGEDGKVLVTNPKGEDARLLTVEGAVIDVTNPADAKVVYQAPTKELREVNNQLLLVNPETGAVEVLFGEAPVPKPDYMVIRDNRTGLTSTIDAATEEGRAAIAKANAENTAAGTTVVEVGALPTDQTPTAKAFLVGNRTVNSFDGGRTYAGPDGTILPMPENAVPLSDTIAADVQKSAQLRAAAGDQLDQLNARLGLGLRTGDPNNPQPASPEDQALVRNAADAALNGTGPWSALAAGMDAMLGGLVPLVRETFQDTQENRQFLRAITVLGRSALVVNPRFPVAEMDRVGALFPDPDVVWRNPRTEANKLVELKDLAEQQLRANLSNLAEGRILDEATRGAVLANNHELERLLSLLAGVPRRGEGAPSATVDSLRNVIRGRRP